MCCGSAFCFLSSLPFEQGPLIGLFNSRRENASHRFLELLLSFYCIIELSFNDSMIFNCFLYFECSKRFRTYKRRLPKGPWAIKSLLRN